MKKLLNNRLLVYRALVRIAQEKRGLAFLGKTVVLEEIEKLTKLNRLPEVWNALRWLRRHGLAEQIGGKGKGGWLPLALPKLGVCWEHGTALRKTKGRPFCMACLNKPEGRSNQ